MRINQNISAMNTYSRLTSANNAKAGSLAKLSSGLRINKAGDDAAGLAISEKMRGQVGGLKQATRNAQDGISLIQTAEGGLNETHSILNRMRELAVQSSNDTNTDDDRVEIQKEMDELSTEISRISTDTEFNTQNLLGGKFSAKFHIGANKGQNIEMSINAMDSSALGVQGSSGFAKDTTVATGVIALAAADITTITGASTATQPKIFNFEASKLKDAVTISSDKYEYGLKNSDGNVVALSKDGKSYTFLKDAGNKEEVGGSLVTTAKIDFGNASVKTGAVEVTTTSTADTAAGIVGISASAKATLQINDGSDLKAGKYTVVGTENIAVDSGFGLVNSAGDLVGKSADGLEFKSTADNTKTLFTITGAGNALAATNTIDITGKGIDVSNQISGDAAIKTIDDAISKVSAERSKLGATQNRLDHTINNLTATAENLSEAESRIRDVDMAEEMMQFTKNNILSQAATSMLAQANQMPQSVLQLLQ